MKVITCAAVPVHLGEAKGVELEVAGVALALDSLEEGNAAEDLQEGGPKEDLRHAARLDEHIVGLDGRQLRASEDQRDPEHLPRKRQ